MEDETSALRVWWAWVHPDSAVSRMTLFFPHFFRGKIVSKGKPLIRGSNRRYPKSRKEKGGEENNADTWCDFWCCPEQGLESDLIVLWILSNAGYSMVCFLVFCEQQAMSQDCLWASWVSSVPHRAGSHYPVPNGDTVTIVSVPCWHPLALRAGGDTLNVLLNGWAFPVVLCLGSSHPGCL